MGREMKPREGSRWSDVMLDKKGDEGEMRKKRRREKKR